MFPKLLQLGPLPLHTYGFFVALGFISAVYTAGWLRRREGLPDKPVMDGVMWMVGSGIFGARLAYVIERWGAEFASAPFTAVLRVDRGGLMFYGGFIAAVLTLALYARFRREAFTSLSDVFCVVLPLGHALGRLGCFFFGCCYGKNTSSWMGVCFPRHSPAWNEHYKGLISSLDAIPPAYRFAAEQKIPSASPPVLPTQLIESAANFMIFALLLLAYTRPGRAKGMVTGLYLMLYGAARFALEFLRGDERSTVFLSLSIGQTISIAAFAAGAVVTTLTVWQARRAPMPGQKTI
ncbi:MAG: prolipoprotein diacylglyceryl transferase [Kiritimatiellaeota bacterium]|nr:prolipoprotein diacylglyceryl transferase [Kiritimatiellota bacterium]